MNPNPFTEVSPFTRALLLVFQDLADEYERADADELPSEDEYWNQQDDLAEQLRGVA